MPWRTDSLMSQRLEFIEAVLHRSPGQGMRERSAWATGTLTVPSAPNEVWAADFKGEFRLTDGTWCYPLTVSDLHSRYVLAVRALASTAGDPATAALRACFAEFGLPRVIRTDNGVPFGAPLALGGLSPLAVWWIRLGIRPERIQKGVPQQNGTHERMHRTLKAEATRPASASLPAQQQRFDRWRQTFNNRRPHEALANTPPARHYTPSPRPLPRRLPILEYAAAAELPPGQAGGYLRWRNHRICLSTVLAGEYVAFEETADDERSVRFGPLPLGTYSPSLFASTEHLTWSPEPP